MRTLAITGIETVSMISRMIRGAAMRATPPSLRISEGTRSSAITAHAPASSAILACSALVTSIITPPFNISARPTFTRHKLLFISSIEFLPRSRSSNFTSGVASLLILRRLVLRGLFRRNNYESSLAARQHFTRTIANLSRQKQIAPLHLHFVPFARPNPRPPAPASNIRCSSSAVTARTSAKAADLAHHFIQHSSYDTAVNKSRPALIFRAQPKLAANPLRRIVLLETSAASRAHSLRRSQNKYSPD